MTHERLRIDPRFSGPPGLAHAGYACGLLARGLAGAVEVAIRRPLPLAVDLPIVRDGETLAVRDQHGLLAEARPARFDSEIPEPVTPAAAELAAARFPWLEQHPFPGCFVCGPGRSLGDGLRLFPGPVDGLRGRALFRGLVAAPLVADDSSLADEHGVIHAEIVWAALDCPTGVALAAARFEGVARLQRMAVTLIEPLRVGERYVAVGWPLQIEAHESHGGSAIFSDMGELCAIARASWVRVT